MSIWVLLDIRELKFMKQGLCKWHFLLNCKNFDSGNQLNSFLFVAHPSASTNTQWDTQSRILLPDSPIDNLDEKAKLH